MLITRKSCCGRIGSLVTNVKINPTLRPQKEFCSYKGDGSCGDCPVKCVNGALSFTGYDKQRCYEMFLKNADRLKDLESIAGKCLVGVPCATETPDNI